MAAFSDFAENKIIDWFFRGQALGITGGSAGVGTGPTSLWIGLLTSAPTDSTPGTEVTGGSYARVAVASSLVNWAGTQAAASTTVSTGSSGTTSNNASVTYPAPTANWGIVTHSAIYDAATAGNQVIYSALAVSKTVNNGDSAPVFAPGALTFQLDN
jgi:hypothetical protein